MEAGAYLEQGADTATGTDDAGGRGGNAGEELQKGRFACSVLTDDAYDIALLDIESDVAQGPNEIGGASLTTVVGLAYLEIRVFFS